MIPSRRSLSRPTGSRASGVSRISTEVGPRRAPARCSRRRGRVALPAAILLILSLAANLGGCGDDDPVRPRPFGELWSEAALPANLGASGILGVAARGSRVVAVGAHQLASGKPAVQSPARTRRAGFAPAQGQPFDSFLLESDGGAFTRVNGTTFPPSNVLLLDVALSSDGEALAVGAADSGPAFVAAVADERDGWHTFSPQGATGGLQTVTWNDGRFIAGGTADGGLLLESGGPDSWVRVTQPFNTPQEKGILDLEPEGSRTLAVGWDDATGPENILLLRQADGTWTDRPGPAADDPDIETLAVASLDTGLYLVGGFREDLNDDLVYEPTALLFGRQLDGMWFSIVLPDPLAMQKVNDLLVVGNDVYLACGAGTGSIWRWDGTTWHDEVTDVPGRFTSLAHTDDGAIFAGGVTGSDASPEPLIVVRKP